MSGTATKKLIRLYESAGSNVTRFLSGFFQSPPQNFHSTESVEIDIVRSDEDIAIVVEDLSTGSRMNSDDLYTNKEFKPPIYDEAMAINAYDALKRSPGANPFGDVNVQSTIVTRAFKNYQKIEKKIRRAIEFQASQVLQTGVVDLKNAAGVSLYAIDYKPKATHFPTAGTAWSDPAAPVLGDLLALATVVRSDGLVNPNTLIMGEDAFENAVKNTQFKERFDVRRIDLGRVSPMQVNGEGGQYRGVVEIGTYMFDIWTYGARYKDPQTGNSTPYVDPDKVIMLALPGTVLDATFGAVPMIAPPDARVAPFMPSRMQANGVDMFPNVWLTPDGKQLIAGLASRPLMIPTGIDTFGCITTA